MPTTGDQHFAPSSRMGTRGSVGLMWVRRGRFTKKNKIYPLAESRSLFFRSGGSLAPGGSVLWQSHLPNHTAGLVADFAGAKAFVGRFTANGRSSSPAARTAGYGCTTLRPSFWHSRRGVRGRFPSGPPRVLEGENYSGVQV